MKELQTTCLIYYKKVLHPDVEGRKDMFYLTTHSTHFIYGYMASYMVEDPCDSEKGNQLPPHRLHLPINSNDSFICTQDRTYHGLCYTSHGALVGTRNSSMGSPHEGSILRPIAPWANALTTGIQMWFTTIIKVQRENSVNLISGKAAKSIIWELIFRFNSWFILHLDIARTL